ncbi:hypothetical protein DPX16_0620 [Anabarilius grahami]|uniref:Uncharacterized protein n=1 Tax=Anabarilius grahami TaxID=495550 RepID=A0A3N0YJH4_ANAGA|nr:hypothetical protein DPX16_0620 [Anabarilius grahami]
MQSTSDTGGDRIADPFATLVNTVRSSLPKPTTSTAPTVHKDILNAIQHALQHPAPAAYSTTMPSAQALVDSGSDGNFISNQILQKLNVNRKQCQQDLRIHYIQGKLLGRGHVHHFSPTLTLRIWGMHSEENTSMLGAAAVTLYKRFQCEYSRVSAAAIHADACGVNLA